MRWVLNCNEMNLGFCKETLWGHKRTESFTEGCSGRCFWRLSLIHHYDRLETSNSLRGFGTYYNLKYRYFVSKDNIVDNFSNRFLCTSMTENTNMGLFTPFQVPQRQSLQKTPYPIRFSMLSPLWLVSAIENFI